MTPNLPEDSKKVLRIMVRKPVITGYELAILAGIGPENLLPALTPLLAAGVIAANTSSVDPMEVSKTYYNLNPSARQFAEFAAR